MLGTEFFRRVADGSGNNVTADRWPVSLSWHGRELMSREEQGSGSLQIRVAAHAICGL